MKFLMLCAVGVLVLGGVFHEDLIHAWNQSRSGGASGVTDSMGGLGGSVGSSFEGVGNSFGQ
ncbi:MAG: hypothetical protein AAF495_12610 [Pseudomonadota bacterium]